MTPKRLYLGRPSGIEQALYTSPGNTILKQVILTNTGTAVQTISISIVPNGGTAGDNNRIIKTLSVAVNETQILNYTQVLHAGDFISSVSTNISIVMSGVEL